MTGRLSDFPPVTLTIKGLPASKKTGARIITVKGRAIPIPAKKYVSYERAALLQVAAQYHGETITQPCHINVRFYRDNRTDVDNLVGGLFDILQKAKVIKNDGLVHSVLATKSGACDGDPRAEVFITPYRRAA
jgi:Holliday junction resolvase RusA-like endonuclease